MTNAQAAGAALDERPVLHLNRVFQASRERVFSAFVETDQMARWWGPEGCTVPEAEIDARPGGAYALHMQMPDGNVHNLSGVFREVVRPEKLVYTWIWGHGDFEGIETLVTLEFADQGGATEVRLTHQMLPSETACDLHQGGWSSSFDCLDRLLADTGEGT